MFNFLQCSAEKIARQNKKKEREKKAEYGALKGT